MALLEARDCAGVTAALALLLPDRGARVGELGAEREQVALDAVAGAGQLLVRGVGAARRRATAFSSSTSPKAATRSRPCGRATRRSGPCRRVARLRVDLQAMARSAPQAAGAAARTTAAAAPSTSTAVPGSARCGGRRPWRSAPGAGETPAVVTRPTSLPSGVHDGRPRRPGAARRRPAQQLVHVAAPRLQPRDHLLADVAALGGEWYSRDQPGLVEQVLLGHVGAVPGPAVLDAQHVQRRAAERARRPPPAAPDDGRGRPRAATCRTQPPAGQVAARAPRGPGAPPTSPTSVRLRRELRARRSPRARRPSAAARAERGRATAAGRRREPHGRRHAVVDEQRSRRRRARSAGISSRTASWRHQHAQERDAGGP